MQDNNSEDVNSTPQTDINETKSIHYGYIYDKNRLNTRFNYEPVEHPMDHRTDLYTEELNMRRETQIPLKAIQSKKYYDSPNEYSSDDENYLEYDYADIVKLRQTLHNALNLVARRRKILIERFKSSRSPELIQNVRAYSMHQNIISSLIEDLNDTDEYENVLLSYRLVVAYFNDKV